MCAVYQATPWWGFVTIAIIEQQELLGFKIPGAGPGGWDGPEVGRVWRSAGSRGQQGPEICRV